LGTGGLFLRKLRAKVSDEPTGFVWVEKGRLAASGYPSSRGQVEWLIAQGIGSILTLTPDPLPPEYTEGLPLELGHVPMQDHGPPRAASLDEAVSFIKESERSGRAVVVHCLAGEGRTGCVLAAYEIKVKGMGAAEALESIRQVKPEFVERSQEKAVFDYATPLTR
jgi:rhodanese/phosphatase family protein